LIWLIASILFSSLIFAIFKIFNKYEVNNLEAIIVNYLVASVLGFFLFGNTPSISQLNSSFGITALIIGFLFITLFNVMAKVTQQNGVSVASVSNKMSVIIPVIVAILLYQDSYSYFKILGIILALLGIYLVTVKEKTTIKVSWVLPLILFAGSGLLDATLNFAEAKVVDSNQLGLFTPTAFAIAAIFGIVYLLYKKQIPSKKSLLFGLVLGIPNYFSIYILLKALEGSGLESSIVFPINNMGVVLVSTLISLIWFGEKLSIKNYIGVAISILAISLIAFSNG
jgi:drug/metabolite transporter (DMT)-like permease